MTEIGLFPLGVVLLPTERLPLHIFEERYKELIGRCLAADEEFGLVFADDEGIRDVGTRAAVVEVLTRFADGRLNILVEGRDRFRLLELTSGESFHTGEVLPLDDEDDPSAPELIERALSLFARLRALARSDVPLPHPDHPQLSFVIAAHVELDDELKLELLADTSERSRLERLCEVLEGAVETLRIRRRALERASGNGRVDLG
ncbi:MAG: LON peptidase substrate-binding domain-containing protein [Thermoleophilia bacterium]|nr:LON peptidase substrate-binding domain-containing protein [Gaiellaceae bacterium]MDW8338214.1 LON peptidase substrate-binding domain-containing protein [Thermoleophilia bacterium]